MIEFSCDMCGKMTRKDRLSRVTVAAECRDGETRFAPYFICPECVLHMIHNYAEREPKIPKCVKRQIALNEEGGKHNE